MLSVQSRFEEITLKKQFQKIEFMKEEEEMNYISGEHLRILREGKEYTQKQLAEKIGVSEKTISKWETGRGLPDISLLSPLAAELNISVVELLNGENIVNTNRAANMKKSAFYVCPLCGNVIHAMGEGSYSCCGVLLPALKDEKSDDEHKIGIERIENQYYLHMEHPMEKEHYISFAAYVTTDTIQMIKFYPEQNIEARFQICGHGKLYIYCNRDGLFSCSE